MADRSGARPRNGVPRELQGMWPSLVRGAWASLAVISTDATTSSRAIAAALVEMGSSWGLGAFELIDAEGVSPSEGLRLSQDLAGAVGAGSRVLVAVGPPTPESGAYPLVMSVDAVLLLVRLGESSLEYGRTIADMVGRDRIVGCVALHPGAGEPPAPA